VLLIASPDHAEALLEQVHRLGAKAILVGHPTSGLGFAREHRPQSVVLRGDRYSIETMLGQLKKHPETRHLPVVAVSEPSVRLMALQTGAARFVEEPVDERSLADALRQLDELRARPSRRIVMIGDEGELDQQVLALLESSGPMEVVRADVATAIDVLRAQRPDLALAVVRPSQREAQTVVREVASDPDLAERPTIVFVPHGLSKADRARLDAVAKSAVMSVVENPERLLEKSVLYLHRSEADLSANAREMLTQLRGGDAQLEGRKVLVIDDDIRNVFALTSSLEQRGMKVVFAENGREGLERLQQHPNTDVVLLDIMMPEMDGYETAQAIRGMPRFQQLPIIAVTAKAMKGDREKAVAAGASDYITKPVDIDQLLVMMRVWLTA
jgi:CheY-like chemotaxis protein